MYVSLQRLGEACKPSFSLCKKALSLRRAPLRRAQGERGTATIGRDELREQGPGLPFVETGVGKSGNDEVHHDHGRLPRTCFAPVCGLHPGLAVQAYPLPVAEEDLEDAGPEHKPLKAFEKPQSLRRVDDGEGRDDYFLS